MKRPLSFLRKSSLIIACAWLVSPTTANALQPLSAFLEAGRVHGLDNRTALATAHQRHAETSQARDRLLPDLVTSADYLRNQYQAQASFPAGYDTSGRVTGFHTAIITPQNQWDVTFTLDVPLIDVGNFRRLSGAHASEDAAVENVNAQRDDIDRQVIQAYYQYVAATAVVQSADDARRVATENRDIVRARMDGGLASDLDVDRAAAQVEAANQTLADAALTRSTAARVLRTLTAVDPTGDIPPLHDELTEEAPLDTWMRNVQDLPNVRAAHAQARSADENENAAWMAYVPALTGSATERFTDAVGFGKSPYYSVGIVARWRLDFTQAATAEISAAQAEAAHVASERAEQTARDQIEDAYLRVDAYRARARAARAQAAASHHGSEVSRSKYEAGTATQLDVVQAERDALAADVQSIQATADLAYARALLRLSAGRTQEIQP